jgi:O-antigen chain-terminating methyltransferase
MSEKSFYRAFEDRHRGPRELIKARLQVYRGFIEPLTVVEEELSGVDLGCGRGEWLELLGEMGISSLGIDLDEGMLSACSERGLNVVHGDAIVHLSNMESESQLVVSAFHLVEHISFNQLQKLVQEAHRVLKPGGILIMETPNPENIMVAGCNFYLDPTHVRPIPPDLLHFMTEFAHFSRSKVVRLQEGANILRSESLSLNDVLGGASPDYAVVAQKSAPESVESQCDQAFNREYGVNIVTLAEKYSAQLDQKIELVRIRAQQAEVRAQQAEHLAISIYSSYSWRVTGPLRWMGFQFRKLKQDGPIPRLKALIKKILLHTPGISHVLKNPESNIRKSAINLSRRIGCYDLARKVFVSAGGRPNSPHSSDSQINPSFLNSPEDLSADAQEIYIMLKKHSQISEKSK